MRSAALSARSPSSRQCLAFGGWIIVNAGALPRVAPFDPFPYPLLSLITSLEAVLLTAFVLIKQNRMGVIADRRDHLDLPVNLLTEQQATQIIQMLDRLSTRLASTSTMTPIAASLGGMSLSSTWSKSYTAACRMLETLPWMLEKIKDRFPRQDRPRSGRSNRERC